jgi:hypothetical protein
VELRQMEAFVAVAGTPAAHTTAAARFVHTALTAELPPGWHTQPDHLHHRE